MTTIQCIYRVCISTYIVQPFEFILKLQYIHVDHHYILYLILIALLLVYTSNRILVLFFSDDPSNHVWKITCRKEYEYAQRRCPKKYILIRLFATSDNEIEGLDNGLKQLGLTYKSNDWIVFNDTSKPSKLDMLLDS